MDPISIHQIISLGAALQIGGPILAVLVIWWIDRRDIQKILKQNMEQLNAYREDTKKIMAAHSNEVLRLQAAHQESVQKILDTYREDVTRQSRMYDNNIMLVKSFEKLSNDQKDVIMLVTQALQRLTDTLKFNRLCPNVKVEGQG